MLCNKFQSLKQRGSVDSCLERKAMAKPRIRWRWPSSTQHASECRADGQPCELVDRKAYGRTSGTGNWSTVFVFAMQRIPVLEATRLGRLLSRTQGNGQATHS